MSIILEIHTKAAATPTTAVGERADLYAPIHKALRLYMTETLAHVSRVDVDDAHDLCTLLAGIESLLSLMRSHVQHENDFVHPAIEARVPGGSHRIADEHMEHLLAIDGIADEVDELRAAAPTQRSMLALRLYRHLALFVAENMAHMHIEETAHNNVLWSCYSDAELRALGHSIESSIPPEEAAIWLRWIARSANPKDLMALMGAMQKEAPPEAFAAALAVVQAQLDEGRWSRLALSLHLPSVPGLVTFG